jgi:hypothetical protein
LPSLSPSSHFFFFFLPVCFFPSQPPSLSQFLFSLRTERWDRKLAAGCSLNTGSASNLQQRQ